jgi:hypothetical protein
MLCESKKLRTMIMLTTLSLLWDTLLVCICRRGVACILYSGNIPLMITYDLMDIPWIWSAQANKYYASFFIFLGNKIYITEIDTSVDWLSLVW